MAGKTKTDDAKQATEEQFEESMKKLEAAADAAVERIHAALDKAADDADQGIKKGARKADRAAKQALDKAEAVGKRGRATLDGMLAHVDGCASEACTFVRQNPAQSVVMALAAGWVIGRLMRR